MSATRLISSLSRPLQTLLRSASSSSSNAPSLPVVPQAPNYTAQWSTNQRPRPVGGESPRFEQTAMDLQPQPLSAMEMINAEPIRVVHGRKAVCDGGKCFRMTDINTTLIHVLGGGALGHPKIFINLVCISSPYC